MKIKAAKKNFSSSMLPKNRREQFFDILKTRMSTFSLVILFSLLSFIPFIISFVFKIYLLDENVATLEPELIESGMAAVTLIFDGVFLIAFTAIFIIYAGLFNVIKKLVYGEGSLFLDDFKIGIKENWKTFLISSVFFGLIKLINDLAIYFLPIQILNYVPLVISYLIFLPILLFVLALSPTYNFSNYFGVVRNAAILCFKKFFFTIIFVLIFGAVSCIYFVYFIPFVALLLYLLLAIILPFIMLAFYLYATSVFDIEINAEENKEFYHKGLMDQFSNEKKPSLMERLTKLEKELRNK